MTCRKSAAFAGMVLACSTLAACSGDPPGSPPRSREPSDSAQAASGSPPADLSGRLLYSEFDEASHRFIRTFVSSPDGTAVSEIPMPGPEGGGRWSRSGQQIAVMTLIDDGRVGTAIIDPEGDVVRVLTLPDDRINLVCTVWSRDDSRLACEGWDDADPTRRGLYTVRASDGADLVRLTSPRGGAGDLPGDYSPDGSFVVFKRAPGEDDGDLMQVPVAGGPAKGFSDRQVEDPGRFSSADGRLLTSHDGKILVMDKTGTVTQEIGDNGQYLFGPVWSPDGLWIAFSAATNGPVADVFVARPDGTERRRVTSTTANEIRVEWGP